MTGPGRPRAAVASLATYRPGRSAEAAMADHGLDSAVKLASNEVPFGPLPGVAEAIARAATHTNRYPDHRATALRGALAGLLGLERSQVAVGDGSVGLLQQIYTGYAGEGDHVVFPWPSFEAYPVYAALAGATVTRTALVGETFDMAAVAAAVDAGTRLVFLANPNNPTGTAVATAEIESLLDTVPESCIVVVDEAYREFVTRADVSDPLALLAGHPNLVVLRTFSKAWALASLRVGYALAHPDVIDVIDKGQVPFCVNGIAQAAALAALDARAEMLRRVEVIVAERDRVGSALRDGGWPVPDTQANFVWLPVGDDAAPLAIALEREGIVTRPFDGVGVRVTIGTRDDNDGFLKALRALRRPASARSAPG